MCIVLYRSHMRIRSGSGVARIFLGGVLFFFFGNAICDGFHSRVLS